MCYQEVLTYVLSRSVIICVIKKCYHMCYQEVLSYVLSLFKKVLSNFFLFIKTHQTIYKNFIPLKKNCFHRGFEFFQKKFIHKGKCGTVTK